MLGTRGEDIMMSRRLFIQRAGAIASGAFAAAAVRSDASQPRRYKLGLQLYTMRAAMARDVDDTLKRVAAMGYEEVETYGFDPVAGTYYRLAATAFAQRLRDHGFTAPSGHYDLNRFVSPPVDDLKKYVDRCIEGARAL